MRGSNGVPAPVDLSVRIYNRLLAAYPGRFRAEYGHHMAQVFRDTCRRDYRIAGLSGMTSLWVRTSLDLIRTTVEEHIERGLHMNHEKFVRWSGWALMGGAILFAAGQVIGNLDPNRNDPIGGVGASYEIGAIVGLALGQVLFVIGLLGLRAGYAERSGSLGGMALIVSVIGAGLSLAGILLMGVTESEFAWQAWGIGLLTMTLGLAIFGVVALRRKVFSRWNFAPLLAAATLLLPLSGLAGEWVSAVTVAAFSIGLVLVGFRMQAEAGRTGEVAT
jgi:hypothetical protein